MVLRAIERLGALGILAWIVWWYTMRASPRLRESMEQQHALWRTSMEQQSRAFLVAQEKQQQGFEKVLEELREDGRKRSERIGRMEDSLRRLTDHVDRLIAALMATRANASSAELPALNNKPGGEV